MLNREVRRTGGRVLITLGDQDIDLSPSFVIFLSTRDPTVCTMLSRISEIQDLSYFNRLTLGSTLKRKISLIYSISLVRKLEFICCWSHLCLQVEFPPDLCSRVTFVNFTVTRSSLQSQCLNEVLKAERPDVDEKRSDLLKLQGEIC